MGHPSLYKVEFGTFGTVFSLRAAHCSLRVSIWQLLASLHHQTSLEGLHIPLSDLLSERLCVSDRAKAPSAHDA